MNRQPMPGDCWVREFVDEGTKLDHVPDKPEA
jgi:hypothetical protein